LEHYVGHIKKGDVVYIPFPLSRSATPKTDDLDTQEGDPREKKDRPVVVLFRAEVDSFTVCAITKQPHREHKIELHGKDLDSGKIDYEPSFIRPNIVTTIERCHIRRKMGTLKPDKLKEVIDKVKDLLDADPEDAPVSKAFERAKRRIR
jgi:mRNA interferase MazF